MSVSFRVAREAEVGEVGRLVAHSFPGPPRTPEWWERQLAEPLFGGGVDVLWVGEEGGRLVAACQLHPLRQWIAGERYPVMGLGTVAISPTHRKRGLAARLITAGLQYAHARGDLLSALYPFRISFYAKLGYGLAGEVHQYRVAPECFRDSDDRFRVELADQAPVLAEVRALYDRWAPGQTGQLERSERVWSHHLSQPDRATVAYRGVSGELEGYARVWYRTDLPPNERFLEVEELAWTTLAARRGLHAWLGSLGDQWRQILVRALPSTRLGDWIDEPRLPWGSAPGWGLWFPSAALLRGPMFRLLDLPGAWSRRAVAPDAAFTLDVEVTDEQVPSNQGRWRLRLEGGRVAVGRDGGGTADALLRLGVSSLSRIFLGALPATAAVEAGLAETDRPERLSELDRALRLPEAYTFDRF